jgi:hypothetical protein
MTLNEMLTALGNIDGHGEPCEAYELLRLNSFEANAIAAALKAGQELADYIEQYCPGFTEEGSQLLVKTKAWDAATKGDER